jgi:hypothetical protein
VCINNRNAESRSCGYSGSEDVVEELRKVAKKRNLRDKMRALLEAGDWIAAPSAKHDDLA